MTEWRTIPGFAQYEASELGDVRRLSGGRGAKAGRVLKAAKATNGYPILSLVGDDRKPHTVNVHRIVALTFLGPRPDGMHISHLDGDRTNPAAANLTYETPRENHARKSLHGTQISGDQHWTRRRATTPPVQISPL